MPIVRASWSLALTCALALLPAPVAAQSPGEEREVLAVVQKMFDAMASCDAAAARSVSVPEGRLYRLVAGSADASPRSSTFEEFNAQLEKCTGKMLERMWNPQVRVHKGIASVWAPYDFWLDGAFSHCGIDSFELARTASGWKLTGGLYTVERDGCAPSPLGPPSFAPWTR